ncbi:GNAT family N-acetyltransferase [Flavobacterium sp.]|uniref:GNAT family N-acetyltransferase n=1 Tax=Flavobacterium sp. TaxID=239 RepID=UPI003D09C724
MLVFTQDYILQNEKVLLRPLMESDFELLLPYSENEPEIWQYNAFGANGAENLKKYIHTALENKKLQLEYPFAVIDKKTGKLIGSTRYYAINQNYNHLEIGFTWYGKEYQGSYVNKNCKYLLLEFAFEKLNVSRVGFKANNANLRSIQAMKSIGCQEEGILRNFATDAKGQRIDVIVLSILQSEWQEEVKQKLQSKI